MCRLRSDEDSYDDEYDAEDDVDVVDLDTNYEVPTNQAAPGSQQKVSKNNSKNTSPNGKFEFAHVPVVAQILTHLFE